MAIGQKWTCALRPTVSCIYGSALAWRTISKCFPSPSPPAPPPRARTIAFLLLPFGRSNSNSDSRPCSFFLALARPSPQLAYCTGRHKSSEVQSPKREWCVGHRTVRCMYDTLPMVQSLFWYCMGIFIITDIIIISVRLLSESSDLRSTVRTERPKFNQED